MKDGSSPATGGVGGGALSRLRRRPPLVRVAGHPGTKADGRSGTVFGDDDTPLSDLILCYLLSYLILSYRILSILDDKR